MLRRFGNLRIHFGNKACRSESECSGECSVSATIPKRLLTPQRRNDDEVQDKVSSCDGKALEV
jgi:hypothetical protein